MVLNRNEQAAIEGLFQRPTLDHAHAWDGKYGTKSQSVTAREHHQDHWSNSSSDRIWKIDASKYRLGVSNPNWRQQIANFTDAGTAFAATDVQYKRHSVATYFLDLNPFHPNQVNPWGYFDPLKYFGQTYYNVIPLYDTSQDSAVNNLAIRRFYDSVSSPFDGATFLGELRETIHMFRHPLKQLNDSIDRQIKKSRKLRDKAVRDARNRRNWPGKKLPSKPIVDKRTLDMWRKAAGSSYLEWKWGVTPLLADISNLFDALKLQLNQPNVEHFKSSAGLKYSLPQVKLGEAAFSSGYAKTTIDRHCHTSVKYTGAVYSRIDSSLSLMDTLIGPPEQLVATAYELFPFSWLLDYGTTMGEALNASLMATRLRYTFVSKTIRHSLQAIVNIVPHKPSATAFSPSYIKAFVGSPGFLVVEKKHVSRNPLPNMPLVSLTWQHKLSTSKVANLAALAATYGGEATRFRNRNRL